MTPQERTVLKAKFIQSAMKHGATLKESETAYKIFTEKYKVEH